MNIYGLSYSYLHLYIVTSSQSFTGDYLQVVHGFKHVDGDTPLKNCILPKYREMTKNVIKYTLSIGIEEGTDDKEYWSPFYEEIAKQTVEAAKDNDRVVLSAATYEQEQREFVIEKIQEEGGLRLEQITVVELTMDVVVKARYLYRRTKQQRQQNGQGFAWKDLGLDPAECERYENEGELTEEKFATYLVEERGGEIGGTSYEDCDNAKKVNVTGRDISLCNNIDDALGLTRSKDWTYESICDKVLPIDAKRDEDMAASGSMNELGKLHVEIVSIRDEQNEEMMINC